MNDKKSGANIVSLNQSKSSLGVKCLNVSNIQKTDNIEEGCMHKVLIYNCISIKHKNFRRKIFFISSDVVHLCKIIFEFTSNLILYVTTWLKQSHSTNYAA